MVWVRTKPINRSFYRAVVHEIVTLARAGKVVAADVVKLKEAKTVQGQSIKIDTASGVKVDGANVVKTDIICKNGVIHVIDAVILPPDKK